MRVLKISDLADHGSRYVTPAELAEYWGVGRKLIYREIREGRLKAARLGPRVLRIRVVDALRFEGQFEGASR